MKAALHAACIPTLSGRRSGSGARPAEAMR